MPLKLNVGISKKIGQPDYGSLGASCNIEVELDTSADMDDLTAFQKRIKAIYSACRQAVDEELARQQTSHSNGTARGQVVSQAVSNRQTAGPANSPSNGHNGHAASQKQLDYIRQLAGQIRGLGERRLETLSQKMFAKPLAAVSSLEASGLIDVLKAIKEGKIELATVLQGAAA